MFGLVATKYQADGYSVEGYLSPHANCELTPIHAARFSPSDKLVESQRQGYVFAQAGVVVDKANQLKP